MLNSESRINTCCHCCRYGRNDSLRTHVLIINICAAVILLCVMTLPASAVDVESKIDKLDEITLQLKWTHAFQFAGYYAAKEQGFYREVGLRVSFAEATPSTDPVNSVLQGEAQYAVGSSGLLLARAAGKPVVVMAVIFQQSPYVIYAAPEISSVQGLLGKRVMLESQSEELTAYLAKEGVPFERFQQIPHSHDVDALMRGDVDAMSGYISSEAYYFKKAEYSYQTFSPLSAGIDFYGDNLFTSENELNRHPERVRAFLAASLRGWHYAKEHRDEMITTIATKYSAQHDQAFLRFEANAMIPLLQPDLIEIGYMNPLRWRHIADTYAQMGLMPVGYPLDDFLYIDDALDNGRLYGALAVFLLLFTALGCVVLYIYRINMRLKQTLENVRLAHVNLVESETRYQQVIACAREWVWEVDSHGLFTYASNFSEQVLGYTPDEIVGKKHFYDLFHPEEREQLKESCFQVFALKKPFSGFENRNLCKDGGTAWVSTSGVPMLGEKGQLLGYRGTDADITERKQTEEILLAEKLYSESLITSLPGVFYLISQEGRFLRWNKKLETVTGRSAEEMAQISPTDLFEGNDKQVISAAIQQVFTLGQVQVEGRFVTKDGKRIPYQFSGDKIIVDGAPCLIGLGLDITERDQAEEALRVSEEKLRLIIDTSPIGICMVDPLGNFAMTNLAYEQMLGYSKEELRGLSFFDVTHPEDRPKNKGLFQSLFSLTSDGFSMEKRYIRKDGKTIDVAVNATGVMDAAGHVRFGTSFVSDITERKQAEEDLQKKTEELINFNYMVSHDLRSPLVTIKTFLGYVDQDLAGGDTLKVAEDMHYIHSAADKMNTLLDDLLQLSCIGRIDNLSVKASLQDLVQEALDLVAGRIAKGNIQVQVTGEPVVLYGDRTRLVEVFQNLIDNAAKFMGPQVEPKVKIGSEIKDGEIVMFVRDNGMGIDPRHKDKLFDMFEKLNPEAAGTGIGLALVKRIVESHGGRIWVESDGIGKGACFWVTLPEKSSESGA